MAHNTSRVAIDPNESDLKPSFEVRDSWSVNNIAVFTPQVDFTPKRDDNPVETTVPKFEESSAKNEKESNLLRADVKLQKSLEKKMIQLKNLDLRFQ